MTQIELKKVFEPLSKYAQKARKDPVIAVKKGKPFAAVVPIRNADEETVSLSTNRKFWRSSNAPTKDLAGSRITLGA